MRIPTRFATRTAAALAALVLSSAHAQSAIYKCVDAQGRVEFTDISKVGCKALDLPGSIAAPPRRAGAGARQPGASVPVTTPANFPRVDSAAQKARDDDRRGILNDELRAEEKKLADLKATFNGGEPERQGNEKNYAKYQERVAGMKDDISRTEQNIDALRREIANIR